MKDGIYDLSDFNGPPDSRLQRGTMSEAELHFPPGPVCLEGRRTKPGRVELRFSLCLLVIPMTSTGQDCPWIRMKRYNVLYAMSFSSFKASGSAYGRSAVSLPQKQFAFFPKRGIWRGHGAGKLVWGYPSPIAEFLGILYNPGYTGGLCIWAFTEDQKKVGPAGGLFYTPYSTPTPKTSGEVFIPDHHPGYISWEDISGKT